MASAPDNFQLELLDMQSNIELKQLFQSENLLEFWSRVPDTKYPNLKTNAQENQWRILRVFKVFSEHPDNSNKILFSDFL